MRSRSLNKPITKNNYFVVTGYKVGELLSLTGIFGAYKVIGYDCFEFSGCYPTLTITVNIPNVALETKINFLNKTITNCKFRVKRKNKGTGISIFSSQVKNCIQHGFQELSCWAAGEFATVEKYNGYITWAKFGFLIREYYVATFLAHLKKYHRSEKTLQDIFSTKEGEKFWIKNGIPWPAVFYLDPDSESNKILNEYKLRNYRKIKRED
jgi:hypothetical protein